MGGRHPGEEFDGLVAGVAGVMSVVQTTALDPNSGMSAARGDRVRSVGHQGQAFEQR
jgi:hypothetical protein